MKNKIPFTLLLVAGLAVLNTNQTFSQAGTLDNTFSFDGKLTTNIGNSLNHGNSVVIQPDGKIVVAGDTWNFSNWDIAVVRYNTNGTLDNTFGDGDGKVTTDFGADDYGNSVDIQLDGKIVVAGYTNDFSKLVFAVVRYNTNGTLDNTFGGGDGKVTTDFGANDYGQSIATGQSIAINKLNQKIVVAGSSNYKFAVAQYNSNGTPDNTFSGDGKVTIDFAGGDDLGYSVAIQPNDSKIVVAGQSGNGDINFAVARLLITGILDATFSRDGKLTTNFGTTFGITRNGAYSVAIQEDKKIVVAGYSDAFDIDNSDFAVARYLSTGALDNTFSGDGKVTTSFTRGIAEYGRSVTIQNDGKIIVVGSTDSDFAVAGYTTNGILDNTFGGGDGKVTTDFGNGDYGLAVAIQKSSGKIVVAGTSYISGLSSTIAVARYYGSSIQPPLQPGPDALSALKKVNAGASSTLRLYPNPVTDILHVEGLNKSISTTMLITDLSGKIIQKAKAVNSNYTLNVKMLPPGIYYVSIVENNKIIKLKFIKK